MISIIKKTLSIGLLMAGLALSAQTLQPGDNAPSFLLKNVDGKMVSLDDYSKAKGLILIFTCNHCPYALAWEDRIIALDKKFSKLGFPVVAINPNDPDIQPQDSFEEMKKRAKAKKFSFPYLFDDKQEVYKTYGATHTPHVFLLYKSDGVFVVRYVGAIDDNYKDETQVSRKYVEMAIEALLIGYAVDPQVTRALGCTIKDKSRQK